MKRSMIILLVLARPLFPQEIVSVNKIGQLTGQPSMNNTGVVNVYGTDLGSMFMHSDGRIYFLFGDTFGPPGTPGSSGDWRSNTMAYTTDFVASDGITFDGWMTDAAGHAKALLEGKHNPNNGSGEVTKIPSAGWSQDSRQFIWFMSVKQWGAPGHWDVNFAEIAYSDDNGNTWIRSGTQWPATSNFIQVAVVEYSGYLYFLGIPAGRFGGVKIARVAPAQVLDTAAYQYYSGSGWSNKEADAVLIVNPPVGELSVLWNAYLQRWMMMYLNESKGCIEARLAEQPEGPWSEPMKVACSNNYPALYGAFMHEKYTENDGEIVYFLMSQFGPYNVFLMRAVFRRTSTAVPEAASSEPPNSFALYQNYPNPFNAETQFSFDIPRSAFVRLHVYDAAGRHIRALLEKKMEAGHYRIAWDGADDRSNQVGSGIYFYRLTAGKYVRTGKAVAVK